MSNENIKTRGLEKLHKIVERFEAVEDELKEFQKNSFIIDDLVLLVISNTRLQLSNGRENITKKIEELYHLDVNDVEKFINIENLNIITNYNKEQEIKEKNKKDQKMKNYKDAKKKAIFKEAVKEAAYKEKFEKNSKDNLIHNTKENSGTSIANDELSVKSDPKIRSRTPDGSVLSIVSVRKNNNMELDKEENKFLWSSEPVDYEMMEMKKSKTIIECDKEDETDHETVSEIDRYSIEMTNQKTIDHEYNYMHEDEHENERKGVINPKPIPNAFVKEVYLLSFAFTGKIKQEYLNEKITNFNEVKNLEFVLMRDINHNDAIKLYEFKNGIKFFLEANGYLYWYDNHKLKRVYTKDNNPHMWVKMSEEVYLQKSKKPISSSHAINEGVNWKQLNFDKAYQTKNDQGDIVRKTSPNNYKEFAEKGIKFYFVVSSDKNTKSPFFLSKRHDEMHVKYLLGSDNNMYRIDENNTLVLGKYKNRFQRWHIE
jgi:hypothetical protein